MREDVVDIRLLGPITAERNGETVSLGGPRQRAVLARLALVAGQVVTVDRLVDDVWAGDPPATAVNTLQSYVSLLRRALGDAQLLRREGPGYVLMIERRMMDVARFEDQVADARAALGRRSRAARSPTSTPPSPSGTGRCSPTSPTRSGPGRRSCAGTSCGSRRRRPGSMPCSRSVATARRCPSSSGPSTSTRSARASPAA